MSSMDIGNYFYYQRDNCDKFTKWHTNHEDSMVYRYNLEGQMIFTRQEIVELGETHLISKHEFEK